MINGLGVLGWGVGGIEAEAAMLGQPVSMLIPQVVGLKLTGKLPEGATATDLVLTVTQMLRKKGVVGKFVEFYGSGLASLPLADRATIANMAPEYGATCGIFPVDDETLRYLRFSGRPDALIKLVEAYFKEQGLFHTKDTPEAAYYRHPRARSRQGRSMPRRPDAPARSRPPRRREEVDPRRRERDARQEEPPAPAPNGVERLKSEGGGGTAVGSAASVSHHEKLPRNVAVKVEDTLHHIGHGAVVIAAITSCTNTSNPSVLMAAGLVAKKAVEKGLRSQPWVKTSLAPGSKVVTDYLAHSGLLTYLEQLRFNVVGFGCTTCIGNSGPLPDAVSKAIADHDLVAAAVLSGNRNFEGRVHPEVRANYLASPPLVVAYALAGTMDIDLTTEPLGTGKDGKPVFLKDIWPTRQEVEAVVEQHIKQDMYRRVYAEVFKGDEQWAKLQVPEGDLYRWDEKSTYVKHPPYFVGMTEKPAPLQPIEGARAASRSSATASRRTTSRRPARSRKRAPRGSTSSGTASRRRTSTRTAPAAATTRSWCAARSRTSASATRWRREPKAASRAISRPARR